MVIKLSNLLDKLDISKYSHLDLDVDLAKSLDANNLPTLYWHLTRDGLESVLPQTKKVINRIIYKDLISNRSLKWFILYGLEKWLDEIVKKTIVEVWLEDKEVSLSYSSWILLNLTKNSTYGLNLLNNVLISYNSKKSYDKLSFIKGLFINMNKRDLNEACKLIENKQPAVRACLLYRKVSPKHTIIGLKALSKLTSRREVALEIDFSLLKELNPEARLLVLDHLIYDKIQFKKIPKREDVKKIMFSSFFNNFQQVTTILNRFDKIVEKSPQ